MKIRDVILVFSAVLLTCGTAHSAPITLTSLIGDKDHGPYPNNLDYSEGSAAKIDAGDPYGFDWGYHAGGSTTYTPSTPVDATLNWTHTVDLTGVTVESVHLHVAVIGLLLGPNFQKLYVGSPLTEITDAFLQIPGDLFTDRLQTFSFALDPALIASGSLAVQMWVKHDEGWGGVDYAELIVNGRTNGDVSPAPVPEPSTITLVAAGALLFLRRFRRRSAV